MTREEIKEEIIDTEMLINECHGDLEMLTDIDDIEHVNDLIEQYEDKLESLQQELEYCDMDEWEYNGISQSDFI